MWKPSPLAKSKLTAEEVTHEMARRFFRWAVAATPAQLAWWAGMGVKDARATVSALGLAPLAEGDDRLAFPEDRDALLSFERPKDPVYRLVGSLDNIAHLRRETASLLSDAHAKIEVWNEKKTQSAGSLSDLPFHAIVDRGQLVGLWDYDPGAGEIVWRAFGKASAALKQEVALTETFVREDLGDARSFSLDSPESRAPRLRALRDAAW
jgi:hypothetical protein